MLKKLVKYGNSNALILDRAILELLNIGEGAVVKLHTDGKSLIITPEKIANQEEVSMTGTQIVQEHYTKKLNSMTEAALKNEQHAAWAPGTENHVKLKEVFKKIVEKYKDAISKFDHQAMLAEIDVMAEKYQGDKSSPEFIKEAEAIQAKYSQGLAPMHKEMAAAAKALGCPDAASLGFPEAY